MAEPMTLTIITPDETAYTGKANFLVGHAVDGQFGILPNHAPMIVALAIAPLRVDTLDGKKHNLAVFGGFCEIEHNVVSIVTPDCQLPESIDVERARRAKERAERRLGSKDPDVDIERAQLALARALLRIRITDSMM